MTRKGKKQTKIKKNKKWNKKNLSENKKERKLKREVIYPYIIVQVLEKSGILDAY